MWIRWREREREREIKKERERDKERENCISYSITFSLAIYISCLPHMYSVHSCMYIMEVSRQRSSRVKVESTGTGTLYV